MRQLLNMWKRVRKGKESPSRLPYRYDVCWQDLDTGKVFSERDVVLKRGIVEVGDMVAIDRVRLLFFRVSSITVDHNREVTTVNLKKVAERLTPSRNYAKL